MNANTATKRMPTHKEIAAVLGVGAGTVSKSLEENHGHVAKSTVERVQAKAREMGWIPRSERPAPDKRRWCNTVFESRQKMVETMLDLRKSGYGNTTIAKKCGVVTVTVRRNIGPTPPSLMHHNRVVAQALRTQKNAARKLYLRNLPVAEYNDKVAIYKKLEAEAAEAKRKAEEAKAQAEEAAKRIVAVPKVNLAALKPTPLN